MQAPRAHQVGPSIFRAQCCQVLAHVVAVRKVVGVLAQLLQETPVTYEACRCSASHGLRGYDLKRPVSS
jgi:hypothetical protein